MKKLTKILSLTLVCAMALMMLVSCSSIDTVKSRFQKAGYEYVTTEDGANDFSSIAASFEGREVKVTKHIFKIVEETGGEYVQVKIPYYAMVLEFESNEALTEELTQSETLKGFVKDAQKSDYIEGNCLLIIPVTSILKADDMVKVFKNKQ